MKKTIDKVLIGFMYVICFPILIIILGVIYWCVHFTNLLEE